MSKRGTSLLSGGHHQSFQGADFRTAGNDMYTPTFNVTFNAGPGTLSVASVTTSPTYPNVNPESSTPQQRRNGFWKQALRFFRSSEFRDALVHQPGEAPSPAPVMEHREPIREVQPSSNPPNQLGSTSAAARTSGEVQLVQNEALEVLGEVNVTPLDSLDLQSLHGQEITNAEIYVRGMLQCRKGLACWHPRPRQPFAGERGVVPGDVGTFDLTDGFKKIFNIWEDNTFLRRLVVPGVTSQLPPNDAAVHLDELVEGHTIVSGSSSKVNESSDGRYVASFEFHCKSEQGSVLACPEAADLEELVDPISLRRFLVKHAGAVYLHANSARRIAEEDSLYIVSGCIKNDSWGLAAWQDVMEAPHDLMKLVRKTARSHEDHDRVPGYTWTHRGMSEAQSGSTYAATSAERRRRKDQCLFLRGFKLSFSRDFRSRLDDMSFDDSSQREWDDQHSSQSSGTDQGVDKRPGSDRVGGSSGNKEGWSHHSPDAPSSSRNHNLASGIRIDSFPPLASKSVHPCDNINSLLLNMTGADCVLSHDDDWRLCQDITAWDYDSCIDLLQHKTIYVRNGAAYLVPRDGQTLCFPSASAGEDVVISRHVLLAPSISAVIERGRQAPLKRPTLPRNTLGPLGSAVENLNTGSFRSPLILPYKGNPKETTSNAEDARRQTTTREDGPTGTRNLKGKARARPKPGKLKVWQSSGPTVEDVAAATRRLNEEPPPYYADPVEYRAMGQKDLEFTNLSIMASKRLRGEGSSKDDASIYFQATSKPGPSRSTVQVKEKQPALDSESIPFEKLKAVAESGSKETNPLHQWNRDAVRQMASISVMAMQNAALALDCIDPTTVVGADYANALLLYNQGEDLAMRHASNGGKVPAGTDPNSGRWDFEDIELEVDLAYQTELLSYPGALSLVVFELPSGKSQQLHLNKVSEKSWRHNGLLCVSQGTLEITVVVNSDIWGDLQSFHLPFGKANGNVVHYYPLVEDGGNPETRVSLRLRRNNSFQRILSCDVLSQSATLNHYAEYLEECTNDRKALDLLIIEMQRLVADIPLDISLRPTSLLMLAKTILVRFVGLGSGAADVDDAISLLDEAAYHELSELQEHWLASLLSATQWCRISVSTRWAQDQREEDGPLAKGF